MNFKSQKGFTLIELMVVMSIISTLSSTVLASTQQAKAKARDTQRAEEMRQVKTAMMMYANDHGGALPDPPTIDPSLVSPGGFAYCIGVGTGNSCFSSWGVNGPRGSTLVDNVLAPYLTKLPREPIKTDPSNMGGYTYWWTKDGQSPGLVWQVEACHDPAAYHFHLSTLVMIDPASPVCAGGQLYDPNDWEWTIGCDEYCSLPLN